jgi:hypothetical protein
MPVAEQVQEAVSSGNRTKTALTAAAAAAATGAATYAVRKVRSHDGGSNGHGIDFDKMKLDTSKMKSGSRSILSSAAESAWSAASDVLIPLAEDAAGSAGKYLAENGPDIVKERIVPKFIEAFNEAS